MEDVSAGEPLDIVQFVEMQKFVSGVGTHRLNWNKEHLAREVLFEIPEQLVGYMKSKNFQPVGTRRSQQQQSSQVFFRELEARKVE